MKFTGRKAERVSANGKNSQAEEEAPVVAEASREKM
jgi:hypothetical protein